MKTLIIHPEDSTTLFLEDVYKTIPNKTVINGGVTKSEVIEMIESHDRIMMMGHGSPDGLFSVAAFKGVSGYIIDRSMVPLLKTKKDSVYIWCHSHMFVNKHELKGFYSGMFISEVFEAIHCGFPETTENVVDESNHGFCNIISKYITQDTETIYEKVRQEYGLIAEHNYIASYNNFRLYKS